MEFYLSENKKGMTLVEMLVVMGILSILFASFFYIWNTMDIFRKSRDSKRINDLQVLDTALKTILEIEKNINLGQENIIYTSLPDSSTTCGSYNLIPVYPPFSYRCQTADNYLKIDGNGWVPVNFTLGKILAISVLPIDPLNNKDYFYTYQVRGGRYKLTAKFESKVNISKMANDGGFEPTLYEVGSDLFIPSPQSGLVGYWSFDEGTGTIAYDLSGYGNNGALYNFNWTTNSGWVTGKIGKALIFDGVDDNVLLSEPPSISTNINNGSVFAWIRTSNAGTSYRGIVVKQNAYGMFLLDNMFGIYDWGNTTFRSTGSNLADNSWHFVGFTFQNIDSPAPLNNAKLYIDGILQLTTTLKLSSQSEGLVIGAGNNPSTVQFFNGLIDEVRIYNRALSDQEIKALYDSTK